MRKKGVRDPCSLIDFANHSASLSSTSDIIASLELRTVNIYLPQYHDQGPFFTAACVFMSNIERFVEAQKKLLSTELAATANPVTGRRVDRLSNLTLASYKLGMFGKMVAMLTRPGQVQGFAVGTEVVVKASDSKPGDKDGLNAVVCKIQDDTISVVMSSASKKGEDVQDLKQPLHIIQSGSEQVHLKMCKVNSP